jgi:hypothetical protein
LRDFVCFDLRHKEALSHQPSAISKSQVLPKTVSSFS